MTGTQRGGGREAESYQLSRRGLLKTGAVAGTAAVVGSSPAVGRAEAVAPAVAAAFGLGISATVVGHRLVEWVFPEPDTETAADTEEQKSWEQAVQIAHSRESFEQKLKAEFGVGGTTPTINTSHGSAVWSAVETSIARSRVNGASESEAVTAARGELNKVEVTAIWNAINHWNKAIEALSVPIMDSATGAGVLEPATSTEFGTLADVRSEPTGSEVPLVEGDNGEIYVWMDPLKSSGVVLPPWMDISDLESEDASNFGVVKYVSGTGTDAATVDPLNASQQLTPLRADHPELGTEELIDPSVFQEIVDTIRDLRNELSGGLTNTTDRIYQLIDVGEIEPSQLISAQDMLRDFDSGTLSPQSASAALIARGYDAPSDTRHRVTVEHPDLYAAVTGWLFLDSAGGDLQITNKTTIAPEQYELAYVVYVSEQDGTTRQEMLSGEHPLEITSYEGGETLETPAIQKDPTAGKDTEERILLDASNSEILSAPAEHPDAILVVEGETGKVQVPVDELEEWGGKDGDYAVVVDTATIGTVSSVEIVRGMSIDDRATKTVTDPSDPEKVKERNEELIAAMEEILNGLPEDGAGGGAFGGGGGWGPVALLAGAAGALALLLGGGGR
jgi:hypothetical protein